MSHAIKIKGSTSLPADGGPLIEKPRIYRKIRRPDPQTVRVLCALGTATVHEAQGRSGLARTYLRPVCENVRIAGACVTVLCQPSDNLMIHASIEVCEPGDVLVVATTSESTNGMFGELLGVTCKAHGVVGLIIDAGVRDTAELSAMHFPVWAKAICAQGAAKASPGSVNVPIFCAGVAVNPGDVIVADSDGVVVVPLRQAAEVARLGLERVEKEESVRERLREGDLTLDLFGLRAKLRELGVEYVNELPNSDSA